MNKEKKLDDMDDDEYNEAIVHINQEVISFIMNKTVKNIM
jgi:hypothetical protein